MSYLNINRVMKGLYIPMSQKEQRREQLKSLLHEWNAAYDTLDMIHKDGKDGLKDLKQTLEYKWVDFEQSFK